MKVKSVTSLVEKNKYPLAVAGLFLLSFIIIYLFFQSLKKDHTLDMVRMEIKLKEESRQEIIKLRNVLEQTEKQLDTQIYTLHIKDSLVALNNVIIDNRLAGLPKKYNEKAKEIDNLMDGDLLDYFNKIEPQPNNDY